MVGCLANLYESVEKLSDSFILQIANKLASQGSCLVAKYSIINNAGFTSVHMVIKDHCMVIMDCMMTVVYITHMIQQLHALLALESMSIPATLVHLPPNKVSTSSPTAKEGYVKGVITYTIMDDLTVTPISTISISSTSNKSRVWKRKWFKLMLLKPLLDWIKHRFLPIGMVNRYKAMVKSKSILEGGIAIIHSIKGLGLVAKR
ncbi:hypothetical protein J1N35_036551 [Gossypium stocksii]|uniref:Uncharacterized protein n=1 Tax=Gossypium stocksii TaxID=47602 RepID=A0A9D3ZKX4_9ROSI|nr:hypothetical protein J1N35_036551 [Gossypium stocksii]